MRERQVGRLRRGEQVQTGEVDVRGDVERVKDERLGEGRDGQVRGGEQVVIQPELEGGPFKNKLDRQ